MKKKFLIILTYLLILFNSNLLSDEDKKILKIGLLAPLSGEYKELGNSFLYSLQLALEELNDNNVVIIRRDSGFNDKEMLNRAVEEIKLEGAKIIIGPITYDDFNDVKKFNGLTFISPSNISPKFNNNVISIGVSLESQLITLTNFIKKQKKTKTVIMYPKNQYEDFVEKKLKLINLENVKIFKYSSNPEF